MNKRIAYLLLCLPFAAHAECIFHLPLNEGDTALIEDQSGLANTFQVKGGAWTDVGGQKMLELNGSGNGITVRPDQLCVPELTLSFWVNPYRTDKSKIKIFAGPNTANGKGYYLTGKNVGGACRLNFASTSAETGQSYLSVSIPYDQFSHLVIRIDGETVKLYVNGEMAISKEMPGKILYDDAEKMMHIGSPYTKYFYGIIRDFRMFNHALNEREIAELFQGAQQILLKPATLTVPAEVPRVDFPSDKLTLPTYRDSENLIQNPSFEQGARYWTGITTEYSIPPSEQTFDIDDAEAKSGDCSLLLYAWPGMKQQRLMVKSFAVPVTPRAVYTLSFYTRADCDSELHVQGDSASKDEICFLKKEKVGLEWSRHTVTFTAPNTLFSLRLSTQGNGKDAYRIWIDDVQLEVGGSASAFTQKPVGIRLVTGKKDNLFNFGEEINAQLVLDSTLAGQADLKVSVTDIYGDEILTKSHSVALRPQEKASVPVPYLSLPESGLYSVVVELKLPSGGGTTEMFRIGRMPFLDNTHRHSSMFGVDRIFTLPDHQHAIARMRYLGLGAKKIRDLLMPPEVLDMYRANGVYLQPYLTYRAKVPYLLDGETGIKHPPYNARLRHESAIIRTPSNEVSTVAESVYRIAKMFPEYDNWTLTGEPETHGGIPKNSKRLAAVKNFMELHRVMSDAVRRGNPTATICSPPPHNIDRDICIPLIEDYLKYGLGDFCDVIKGHAYGDWPENPDLDVNLRVLSSLLDEYNFSGDIWLDEDMNYAMHVIPELGADVIGVQNSGNWGQNWLSYDLGLGEQMNAAFTMRQWLIALKNQQRVKSLFWHNYRDSIMDLYATPRLSCWAPNTLGNVLGDAVFSEEVVLSDDTRCYVFVDGQDRPIAALWSCNPDIDRQKRKPYVLHPALKGSSVRIDFCGKESPLAEGQKILVGSLPVFLRSEDTNVAAFVEGLERSFLEGGSKSMLSVELNLLSSNAVEWVIGNTTGKELSGELNLLVQGNNQVSSLSMGVGEVRRVSCPITTPAAFSRIEAVAEFTKSATGQKQNKDLSFVYIPSFSTSSAITIDGDLSEWGARHMLDIPDVHCDHPVKIGSPADAAWGGKQDLSASMYTAWDDAFFYIAFEVTDDVYAPSSGATEFWERDSLQIYFDSQGDARNHGKQGYDSNDYNYNVYRDGDDYTVFREVMPDFQIAFLKKEAAKDIQRAFRKTDTGYIVELAVPFKDLDPARFGPGNSFGFALLINDNDEDFRRRSLTLTPAGTTPFKKPHLWPLMHLVH